MRFVNLVLMPDVEICTLHRYFGEFEVNMKGYIVCVVCLNYSMITVMCVTILDGAEKTK